MNAISYETSDIDGWTELYPSSNPYYNVYLRREEIDRYSFKLGDKQHSVIYVHDHEKRDVCLNTDKTVLRGALFVGKTQSVDPEEHLLNIVEVGRMVLGIH